MFALQTYHLPNKLESEQCKSKRKSCVVQYNLTHSKINYSFFAGTVIERSGKKYKIKYAEEEELFSINVANFKKGLKERTIRLL